MRLLIKGYKEMCSTTLVVDFLVSVEDTKRFRRLQKEASGV